MYPNLGVTPELATLVFDGQANDRNAEALAYWWGYIAINNPVLWADMVQYAPEVDSILKDSTLTTLQKGSAILSLCVVSVMLAQPTPPVPVKFSNAVFVPLVPTALFPVPTQDWFISKPLTANLLQFINGDNRFHSQNPIASVGLQSMIKYDLTVWTTFLNTVVTSPDDIAYLNKNTSPVTSLLSLPAIQFLANKRWVNLSGKQFNSRLTFNTLDGGTFTIDNY